VSKVAEGSAATLVLRRAKADKAVIAVEKCMSNFKTERSCWIERFLM